MATIKRFEDLEIWQMARELCQNVFQFINRENFSQDYKLSNQINGSSGSAMDNVAEGFERGSRNEFIQFLGIAKGSAAEAKSQLHRALDRKYITQTEYDSNYTLAEKISKGWNGLISYLNQSEYKGEKFKNRVSEPEELYSTLNQFTIESNLKPQISNPKPK
jgi:four helix bundle protein